MPGRQQQGVTSFIRRSGFLVLLATAGALSFSLARAQEPPAAAPSGGTPPPKPIPIVQFVSSDGKWAWLKHSGDEVELFRGGPDAAPKSLGKGRGWSEITLAGDELWLLNRTGPTAELLHSAGGAAPVSMLKGLPGAGGLRVAEGRLFWVESTPPAATNTPFMPAAATGRLRVREASGQVRTIAEWPGGQPGSPGDVVGVANGQVYVRLRRSASTEFLRVPLTGGEWERLAVENDVQQGILAGGVLYWTAPTEESSDLHGRRCIRRLSASGTPETLTDWLSVHGDLHPGPRAPYYLSSLTEAGIFELPEHLEEARLIRSAPYRASMDGDRLIDLDGPNAPSVVPATQH